MRNLLVLKAKPNPSGKDRYGNIVPSTQLAGEWVDFKNTGDEPFPLKNIKLQHVAYTSAYPNGVWEEVTGFSGTLPVGEVVRVHSGGKVPLTTLSPIDVQGTDHHIFTGKNYVWNNNRQDTARLKDTVNDVVIDSASYDDYPPEGKILMRMGNKLV